jgi:hypothetical protein
MPEAGGGATAGCSLGFVVFVGLVLAGLFITITLIKPAPVQQRDQLLEHPRG